MRNNQKICLELYTSETKYIFIKQRKLEWKLVASTKKFYYLFLPLVNIQTLRIGDIDLDLYLSDNKI